MTPARTISILAESGGLGLLNGPGNIAQFSNPREQQLRRREIYIGDLSNNAIRKITPTGVVSTLAGGVRGFNDGAATESKFYEPGRIKVKTAGKIFVTYVLNSRIPKIQW